MTLNREEVVKANIQLHTKLSSIYNETEPHFYPENQEVVRSILEQLKKETSGTKHLDIGCGTGFILNLSHDLFEEVCGIDATKAMLDRVDTHNGKVKLFEGLAEELPFDDQYFDIITGYSFLHHLYDIKPVIEECFRVLRPGGKAYFDLDPNKDFWMDIKAIDEKDKNQYSKLIQREMDSVKSTAERIENEHGIDKEVFHKAEYIKDYKDGISPNEFTEMAKSIGFSDIVVEYYWYPGQGNIIREHSKELASQFDGFLKELLPNSRHIYKYLRFLLKK